MKMDLSEKRKVPPMARRMPVREELNLRGTNKEGE